VSEAKPDVWMPWVIGRYLKHTARLTTEQHGAMFLMLMDYWIEGPPPDDDDELASITRLGVRDWKRHRPKLVKFFEIVDGRWRHADTDSELQRWTEKKAKYVERAAAGGRAKAAKSTSESALSMLEATKTPAPQPTSGKVRAPKGALTLTDEGSFLGPQEVRQAFVAELGEAWCGSYLDRCAWQDVPERALIPPTTIARQRILREGRGILAKLGIAIQERAA